MAEVFAASDPGFPDQGSDAHADSWVSVPQGQGTLMGPHAATEMSSGGGVDVNLSTLLTDSKSVCIIYE
jgi:hypothetical protein